LRSGKAGQVSIQRPERQMARFASGLEHKAVRKPNRSRLPKLAQRGHDCLGVFNRQLGVIQQNPDGFADFHPTKPVDGAQDPDELHQHQLRDPRSAGNESLAGVNLAQVISYREAH
jgi:hypothetical protein